MDGTEEAAAVTDNGDGRSKLHDTVAAAYVRAHQALAPHVERRQDERLTGWLDRFEDVARDALAPHLQQFIDDPTVPADVRATFAALAQPTQAVQSGLLFAALGAVFYPLVSSAMAAPAAAIQQASFVHDPNLPLSPAELALGMIRNNPELPPPYDEAKRSGYDAKRLNALAWNTGDAPAIGDLLLLWRRGKIDVARVEHGLRQSRIRDEWLDAILALRYAPVSAGLAVEGALKGHISDAEAQSLVAIAGTDPANYPWMRATAGRPPGIEQMLHLRNRGQASTTDVEAAVRQSDINDDFLPFVLHLGEYHPPVRSIMAMLRSGAIDDTRATTLFKNQGVLDVDIPGYLREAHHSRTATVKTLSQSQVITMYLDGIMSHATAHTRLVALGYQAGDTDLLLTLADDHKRARYAGAVITRIHTLYVAHKIDVSGARNALAADGIDPTAINDLLALWDIERSANVHAPTVPMVLHAYRQQYITPHETKTRLLALGVQPADLGIVVANGFPPTEKGAPLHTVVNAVLDA